MIIELDGVDKRYGQVRALDGADLAVAGRFTLVRHRVPPGGRLISEPRSKKKIIPGHLAALLRLALPIALWLAQHAQQDRRCAGRTQAGIA